MPLGDSEPQKDGSLSNRLLRSLQVHTRSVVYGATDGSHFQLLSLLTPGIITIFAVVAGVSGASLPSRVLLVLGIATLLADAMSMSVSDYMSSTAEMEVESRTRKEESQRFEDNTDRIGQIVYILRERGFKSDEALTLAPIIVRNKEFSIDLLVAYRQDSGEESSPFSSAVYTFFAFIFFGMIPLLADILFLAIAPVQKLADESNSPFFLQTSVLTAMTLAILGYFKAVMSKTPPYQAIIQMVLIGGTAAFTSWLVALLLSESVAQSVA